MSLPQIDELNRIQKLHDCAMDQAEEAMLCKMKGDLAGFERTTRIALDYEREAANLIASYTDYEPSRSVLHRSAAALALDLGEWRIAEQLVCVALSGNPADEIATELRDILEQTQFDHHFQIRGISLSENDTILTLAGPAVAPGMIEYREFRQRADAAERLFLRTAERKMGIPYREDSYIPASTLKDFRMHIGLSQAASYAMPIRIGKGQLSLPGMNVSPEDVVDEVLTCVELLNEGEDKLERHITDKIYLRNFVALHKKLAPDGEQIRTVGLTIVRGGRSRVVTVRQPAPTVSTAKRPKTPIMSDIAKNGGANEILTPSTIVGVLKFADGIKRNVIRLLTKDNTIYNIHVPEGMMSDIVKPLWGQQVEVTGRIAKSRIDLEEIRATLENESKP